jgi:hypothetical protein
MLSMSFLGHLRSAISRFFSITRGVAFLTIIIGVYAIVSPVQSISILLGFFLLDLSLVQMMWRWRVQFLNRIGVKGPMSLCFIGII